MLEKSARQELNAVLNTKMRLFHFIILYLFSLINTQAQQSYTFTSATGNGSVGPNQGQINAVYANTSLSLAVTVSAGIQSWTVPATGLYIIDAYGASGGDSPMSSQFGGYGAKIQGQFILSAGGLIQILVGQRGLNCGGAGGGGGGSFVTYNGNLLIAAGGGGGASYDMNGIGGSTLQAGTMCTNNQISGGSNGGGGSACMGSISANGGGGGGFNSGASGNGVSSLQAGGGVSFLNGGFGGSSVGFVVCSGGFGGGGAVGPVTCGGGGGGGYSGGAGGQQSLSCTWSPRGGGGGGGSFNSGVNQTNIANNNPLDGKVIISYLCNGISLNSNANPICSGNTVTLSTNAISNYSWSNGSTLSNIVVSPTVTTTYSVVGQSSLNCMSLNFITVSVSPQPSLSVIPITATACANSNLVLTANGIGGTAPYNYTWTGGPQSNSIVLNNPSGNYIQTISIQDANGCMTSNTIMASFIPSPVLSTSSISVCQNSIATLTVNGANTYTWQPSGFSGSSYTLIPSVSMMYTVQGTALNGCTSSTTALVIVKSLPALLINSSSVTCASLGSATVQASGGPGPFSYTWMPSAQNTSIATGLNPNTYTLTVYDQSSACTSITLAVFNSSVPLTGSLVSSANLACFGAPTGSATVINLNGGSANQNYLWSNGFITYSTALVTNLVAGQWSITVSDVLTACQINSVFTITQPPALSANIIASSATACAGSSITFSAITTGGVPGYTYTWSTGGMSSTLSTIQTMPGNYTYTLNLSDANSCQSSQTLSVSFVPNPSLSISSVSICPLQIATLTVSGANSYTWLPSFVTGSVLILSPLITQQYTLIGEQLGCTSTATTSIILKALPQPTLGVNSPLCSNQIMNLFANGGSGYIWSGPSGFTSSVQNPQIINPGVNLSGIYTATVTGLNSCTATASLSVIIHPTPTLSAIGSTACSNQSISLSAFSSTGYSYLWQGPNSFTSSLQSPVISNPSASLSGQYTVTVTSMQNCTNAAVATVNITQAPVVFISGNNFICVGSSLQLNANGSLNYSWSGPAGFSSVSNSATIGAVSFNNSGTYTLTATTGPCVINAFTNVVINPLPNPVASYNAPLCELKNLLLHANSASSYTWNGPQNFYSNSQNPTLSTISNSNSGNYTLSVTDANGCVADTILTVVVLQNPIAIVNSASVCAGGSATLHASGGLSYAWSGPNNFVSTTSSPVLNQVNINQSGAYTVVVTGSNSCNTQTIAQLLVMNYALTTPTIVATPSVCINSNISIKGIGGISYAWSGPNNFASTSYSISFVANDIGMTGIYTLSILNASNCSSSATVFIEVFPLPSATLCSSHNSLCVPFCSEFKLLHSSNSAPLLSFQYYIEGNQFNIANPNYCVQSPGENPAYVIFTDVKGCINTSSLLLTGYPKPLADFEFYPKKPIAGIDLVQFTNSSTGQHQNKWTWYFSNGDTVLSEQTGFLFEEAGKYPVVLLLKNDWNCSDTVLKIVEVEDDFALYIPNSFTPNGDGLNDIFRPTGSGLNDYSLVIYNRWGVILFISNDFEQGWDGFYQDNQCKQDTYCWKIQYKINSKSYERTGTMTLLR